jgi:hypothetical protein
MLKMRKWLIRISLSLLILVIAVVAIVQAVLWSPLPKRIVTQQIEKELGLRISCDSLRTGWLGKSELTNVSLGLPLSPGDFLKVKTLRIKHSSLIGLALGNVTVDSVEIDQPVVEVLQNQQGQWNLQQVAVLLGRLGGGNSTSANAPQAKSANTGVPLLPTIKLMDGTIQVTDKDHHQLNLRPLNVTGDPSGLLVWNYDLTIGDSVHLNGRVAPGGNWQHTVTLTAHKLDPLLKDWGIATYGTDLNATWYGQLVSGGKITGTLVLNQMTAKGIPTLGDVSVGGSILAENEGSTLLLHPNRLDVKTSYVMVPELGVESGTIVSDASGLHAQALKVRAFGGLSNLDASFDPRSMAIDLAANWSGLSLAKKTSQSGSLTASLRQPFANQPVIKVDLVSTGTVGDTTADALSLPSRWSAKVNLTGQGNSWQSIDWVLNVPQMSYITGSRTLDLSQLSAHVSQRLPVVELTDLSLPAGAKASANFVSSGRWDTKSTQWSFQANGGFATSFEQVPLPVNISVQASGTDNRYDLKNLTVAVSNTTVSVDGSYDGSAPPVRNQPTPVALHVTLSQEKKILPDAPIQGELAGKFDIVGDLFKQYKAGRHFRPYLTTKGDLTSTDLVLFGRPIGDMDIKLAGDSATPEPVGDKYPRTITNLKTTEFYLFQAPWALSIDYPNPQGVLQVSLETHQLPVDELARFAGATSGISGQITDAKWVAKIPSMELDEWDLHSEYHLTRLAAAGLTVDTVDIVVNLHDGVLKMEPLLARSGKGTLTTTASFDLNHPRHLNTETTVDKWPYELTSDVVASLSGHCILDVNLNPRRIGASGAMTGSLDLLLHGVSFAHAEIQAESRNRLLEMKELTGHIGTGTLSGAAKIDLDKPLQASGQIVWRDFDAATFATFLPAIQGAGGTFSGVITVAPARDPRPLEPVRIDINVASVGGHFRSMKIGGDGLLTLHAVAYANTDRAVLDHSDLFVAGGQVHVWARIDDRSGAGLSGQTSVQANGLELDQIAHVDPAVSKPMPGLVNLQVTAIRSGSDAAHLLLQCHADLVRSDLVNFGPMTALYNLMNAAGGISRNPDGYGSVDLSYEQNVVHVNSFRYFNRGIDARGIANFGPIDFSNLEATPIGGQVVGTARALKGSNVKILSDFDQYFAALQSNLTTINVVGTLNHMSYPQAGLADIGTAMRELLVGDSRK